MDETFQEYQIEKIQKKLVKNKQIFYYVKWFGLPGGKWLHQDELATAKHEIEKFEKKQRFQKEVRGYLSEKKQKKEKEDKCVIIVDSEEELKPIICISSDEDEQPQQQDEQPQHQDKPCENTSSPEEKSLETVESNAKANLAPREDELPHIPDEQLVDVNRYNYTTGIWQTRKCAKRKLLKAAIIRETFEAYQAMLPPIKILKAVTLEGKKMIRFQCKGRIYQSHYDLIRKYRPAELLQFYEARKDLFCPKRRQHKL